MEIVTKKLSVDLHFSLKQLKIKNQQKDLEKCIASTMAVHFSKISLLPPIIKVNQGTKKESSLKTCLFI